MAGGANQAYRVLFHRSTSDIEGGSISYDLEKPLGQPTDGTTSYEGVFGGQPVAVKRYVRREGDPEPPEVEVLRYIDIKVSHPNVARFYCVDQLPACWLIAMQLGQCSLFDYLKDPQNYPNLEILPLTALDEITRGLNTLHSINIAHRDIRPGSIILSYPDADGHCRAMVEGFALTKLIPGELEMSDEHHQRRYGWHAPEILNKLTTIRTPCTETRGTGDPENAQTEKQEEMLAGDIFALGCLFYYTLTKGSHPFGNRLERDGNINSETYQVPFKPSLFKRYYGAQSLITSMIQRDPKKRPKILEVMNHPMFWTNAQILQFLEKASEHVQYNPGDLKERFNALLGAICPPPQRNDWIVHVDPILVDQLNGRRGIKTQLNGQSVLDLLRAIRNSKHHYRDDDWTPEVKNLFGSTNDGFFQYWMNRFPELLLQLWRTLQVLKEHPEFATYYDGTLRRNSPANAVQREHL